ncbi:hypothetical protein EXT43_07260 [Pseudoalteromonas sp. CO109Y]|uniref:NAD-binding protein n=1 Tax=Pseudoalteromonas sp. CO109Y TaxID=1777235 RepID=UPI001022F6E6|nr:NAD-binding protein [Pseudoalteromonas sp. CO109Y]RZF85090.1 hypothetical protein EXT43_07260 [Pseudoalteromonas sp. CO109Y]
MDSQKKSTLFLFGLFMFIMLVGLFGVSQTTRWSEPLANNIYAIAGLFAFSGDWTQELYKTNQMNPFIEFARFAAPLTTALIFFYLIFDGAKQLIVYLLRPRSDFQLVIGLGNKGSAIALSALAANKSVIAIESNPENSHIALLKQKGAIVHVGDINQSVAEKFHLQHAEAVFFCCGDDSHNITIAQQVLTNLPNLKAPVFVHLHSRVLADQLKQLPRFIENTRTELRFWRKSQLLAEQLFAKHSPLPLLNIQGKDQVHLVIFGSNDAALDLARTYAKSAIYSSLKPVKITLITTESNAELSAELTAIDAAAELNVVNKQVHELLADKKLLLDIISNATQIYIFDTQQLNCFSIALTLRNKMLVECLFMAPIYYATSYTEFSEQQQAKTRQIPDNLVAFNDNSKDINISAVTQPRGSVLAKRAHEQSYQANQANVTSWQDLPYSLKEANRAFALSWREKLAMVNARFSSHSNSIELSDNELNMMSSMEHARWCAERKIDGWQFSSTRSNIAKRHTLIKPWHDLTQQQQQGNSDFFASAVNDLLLLAKDTTQPFGIEKVVTVAVTGHRFTNLESQQHDTLVRDIDQQLDALKQAHPNCHFQFVSGLAEGADRLVIERALTRLEASFIALLPMAYELYKLDFSKQDSEFEQLLAKAQWFAEIPPVYRSLAEMEDTANESRALQYASLAAHLVAMADELIAVWDSQPSRGVGGTADVVNWWQHGVPEQFKRHYPFTSKGLKAEVRIVDFKRD